MLCLDRHWHRQRYNCPSGLVNDIAGEDSLVQVLWHKGYIAGNSSGTTADTLLDIYLKHGLDMTRFINGSCCWVIWDGNFKRLIFASDRLGQYSIYYHVDSSGSIFFSSHISRLLKRSNLIPDPDENAIICHLYSKLPHSGTTFFNQISKVPAGNLLVITRSNIESHSYWKLSPQPVLKLKTDHDYAQALKQSLYEVIESYSTPQYSAISLSGGLDSTSICAILSAQHTGFRALSWRSPEVPETDESGAIESVIQKFDIPVDWITANHYWPLCQPEGITTPTESPLRLHYTEAWEATFELARNRGITTIYTGLGGDELFGGNIPGYADMLLSGHWFNLTAQLRSHQTGSVPAIVRKSIFSPILHSIDPNRIRKTLFTIPWLGERYKDSFKDIVYPENIPRIRMSPNRFQRFRNISNPLFYYGMEVSTRLAANSGVKLIHPLADHRLLEFAASLPAEQTFKNGRNKYVLRNAMRGLLPGAVLDRRQKVTPARIAKLGLREKEQQKIIALMTDMKAADMGFVNEQRLNKHYREYVDKNTDDSSFWNAITLEDWLRRHFP